jgi:hypothetical protein
MAFPNMYSHCILMPAGDPRWATNELLAATLQSAGTNYNGFNDTLSRLNSKSPVVTAHSAQCRESTLGMLQTDVTSLYPILKYRIADTSISVSGEVVFRFNLAEKVNPDLGKQALAWSGLDKVGAKVTITKESDSYHAYRIMIRVPLASFDMGKVSVLLFCMSRFPGEDISDAKRFLKMIMNNARDSFPNNTGNATFLSAMMAYALYTKGDSSSYANRNSLPQGYDSVMPGARGIVDLTYSYAKQHPQSFMEFCYEYKISLDSIEDQLPFADEITWTDVSKSFMAKKREMEEMEAKLSSWGTAFDD